MIILATIYSRHLSRSNKLELEDYLTFTNRTLLQLNPVTVIFTQVSKDWFYSLTKLQFFSFENSNANRQQIKQSANYKYGNV